MKKPIVGLTVIILISGGLLITPKDARDNTAFDSPAPDISASHSLECSPANVDTDTAEDSIDQESLNPGTITKPTYTIYLPLVVKNYSPTPATATFTLH